MLNDSKSNSMNNKINDNDIYSFENVEILNHEEKYKIKHEFLISIKDLEVIKKSPLSSEELFKLKNLILNKFLEKKNEKSYDGNLSKWNFGKNLVNTFEQEKKSLFQKKPSNIETLKVVKDVKNWNFGKTLMNTIETEKISPSMWDKDKDKKINSIDIDLEDNEYQNNLNHLTKLKKVLFQIDELYKQTQTETEKKKYFGHLTEEEKNINKQLKWKLLIQKPVDEKIIKIETQQKPIVQLEFDTLKFSDIRERKN